VPGDFQVKERRRMHLGAAARSTYSDRGYRARKAFVALFVTTYVTVASLGGRMSPQGEFFPVFNWSLFTHVHPSRGLLELYVIRIGDKTFDQPVNYFELDSYFETARVRSTDLKKTLSRYAAAKRTRDTRAMAKLRAVIEGQHLSGHGRVEYEIRYVVFRPIDRWLHGKIERQRVVARFDTGLPP
jgi:hypothetical protein